MTSNDWIERHTVVSLERLWPRIEHALDNAELPVRAAFEKRLRHEWPRLFRALVGLYGNHYDFFYHLEQLLLETVQSWLERPAWLRERDVEREAQPDWFRSQTMIGGVLYVDRFAGTLDNLTRHIPYLKELGVTYLHLMPLFAAPEGDSDGGYAVSSYRDVDARLGSMDDLRALAHLLRDNDISLVVDFVFNHTSDEHLWATRAQQGDPEYQDYYYIYPDRTIPDQYERTLREIFPTVRRGSFTWREDMRRWVWTTFNSFQWDLNYSNPAVFRAMASEMLFLANAGVEILRLDAVAFIWKQIGTSCENLPEAHTVIQAYNALARIAAPSLLFKSEAIVHPDEVARYISPEECQISYNPTFMALLWEAMATGETRLLAHSMHRRYRIHEGCAWVNYLRCHDDIGWTFDDQEAREAGLDPYGHRKFLNDFYIGRFPGTFARGLPFQENPDTGDARVSGTLASLAGLEQALQSGDDHQVVLAIRRILMLHAVILAAGGIPLLYLGDELAQLNDYTYAANPALAGDSRWVHRPRLDWKQAESRYDPGTSSGQVFGQLQRLIALRKAQPAFHGGDMNVIDAGNPHLFAFVRQGQGERLLIVANVTGRAQSFEANRLRVYGPGYQFTDLITGEAVLASEALMLDAYRIMWLALRVEA